MQFHFAIVGAGPAGIYAAEALLKKVPECTIDIVEALSAPYGLVRFGVAPDHYKIKDVSRQFEKTLSHPSVSFLGNIRVGEDVSIDELRMHYHAVILAHGTQKDRALGIPGEDLEGSHTATSFVGWYNSHPWFKDVHFDLKKKTAVLIGQGNVAIDVARILLKSTDSLHPTDIGLHAEEVLSESTLEDIYLIGRRGPLQMACTDKELKELGEIPDIDIIVSPEDLILTEEEQQWLEQAPKGTRRNYEILKAFSELPLKNSKKKIHIKFLLSPVEILGSTEVHGIRFAKNILSGTLDKRSATPGTETEEIPCDLVFRSVGYLGQGLPGLPFDIARGVYPNRNGRIFHNEAPQQGLYTSGWIKRGPSGVIGTNKADSVETVASVTEDLSELALQKIKPPSELWDSMKSRGHIISNFEDWKKIDLEERSRGETLGKVSHKFRTQEEMIDFLSSLNNTQKATNT
jgi:ferredoxin/flavodoxin---NADP+ reductase